MSFAQGEGRDPLITRKSCAKILNKLADDIISKAGSGSTTKLVIIGPPQSGKKTFLFVLRDLIREKLYKDEKTLLKADTVFDRCEVKLIVPGLNDEAFLPLSKFEVSKARARDNVRKNAQRNGINEKNLKLAIRKFLVRSKSALEYELDVAIKQYVYIGCDNNGCVPIEFKDILECDPNAGSASEKLKPFVWKFRGISILKDLQNDEFRYYTPEFLERFKESIDGNNEAKKKETLNKLEEEKDAIKQIIKEFGLGEFMAFDIIASTGFFDLTNNNFDRFFSKVKLFGSTLLSVVFTQTIAIVLLIAIGMIIERKKEVKDKLELVMLADKWSKLSEDTKYVIATALGLKCAEIGPRGMI